MQEITHKNYKNEITQLLYALYRSKKISQSKLQTFNSSHLEIETIFMNTENSKNKESNKFGYYFTDKLKLKGSNKNIALVSLSFYYTWKNIEFS